MRRLWSPTNRSPIASYALAMLAVATATVSTEMLEPIRERSPFLFFMGAICLTTWYGGRGPGLLSVIFSVLLADYFFITPVSSLHIHGWGEWTRLGVFSGVAWLIFSLTQRLRISEDRIQALNHELEQRIAERTKALEHANRELQELDRRKSLSLSVASHEFRTPLTSIKGSVDNLVAGIAGECNGRIRADLIRIQRNTDRLIRLTNNLLDLTLLESDTVTVSRESFHVHDVVTAVLSEFQELATSKGITIDTVMSGAEKVYADRDKVEEILNNLVHNALKFTQSGGQVTLEVSRLGDAAVEISVVDTGRGIPADKLERIFEKFQRARKEDAVHGGAGLGLTITKRLVALQGGHIRVESIVGQGSRFRFTLPTAGSSPSA